MTEDLEKRGPGRPPVAKKGKPTWKPANVVDVIGKEPGYRYRLMEKSARNLAKKEREGWEIVSGLSTSPIESGAGYGHIDAGKPLTSVHEGQDYIVGRISEELAQERDAHFNGETARKMSALKRQTRDDLSKSDAPIHGSISIEKRGVRTVISD